MYTWNCQRTNLISKEKNKTTKLNSGIPSVVLLAVSKTFRFLSSMVAHACNANTRYADLCDSRPVRVTHLPSLLYCFPACFFFFLFFSLTVCKSGECSPVHCTSVSLWRAVWFCAASHKDLQAICLKSCFLFIFLKKQQQALPVLSFWFLQAFHKV